MNETESEPVKKPTKRKTKAEREQERERLRKEYEEKYEQECKEMYFPKLMIILETASELNCSISVKDGLFHVNATGFGGGNWCFPTSYDKHFYEELNNMEWYLEREVHKRNAFEELRAKKNAALAKLTTEEKLILGIK